MLFTLGLLLLLTPFPSFQSTSNDRRNTAGSNMTKPNAGFALSKPKTTAAPPKQAVRATLKPNTVNQTVLPTPATSKSKPSPSVIQTTPSVAVKSAPASGTIANKVKHTVAVNQTVSTKSPSAADVKVLRDKPATAGALNPQSASTKSASTHSAKTAKDKLQAVLNQTVTVKPPPASDAKSPKEKPTPTGGPTLHSASTKSASTSSFKTTKDKLQPVLNQTVTVNSPSASDGKAAKDKPAPPVVQNIQSTSPKTGPASSHKTAKNKPAPSVNQTVVDKAPSGSDAKKAAAVAAVPTKNTTAGGSAGASANQTAVSKATAPKEKPAAAQPIQVVIGDGCESGSSKEQELKLKPGAPLVMTHKISLLPGGCSGGCDTEMTALKERVARLEREMSSFKDNCPCSANCPNDCSGNGECLKGKCFCQDGFTGPDCSKCVQGAECMKKAVKGKAKPAAETVVVQGEKDKSSIQEKVTKGESILTQGKEQKKVTEGASTLSPGKEEKKTPESKEADTKPKVGTDAKVNLKTQSKQEGSTKKTPTKDSSGTTKTTRPTATQQHLKHDRASQEESRKEKTVAASKKAQKPEVKLVRDGTTSKTHSSSEQLKDEPQTNATQSSVKTSSGSSKTVTTLSKSVGADKTKVEKESLERSTLAEKSAIQSAGQKNVKKIKVEATTSQSTENKNPEANKTVKDAEDKVPQKSQNAVNATVVSTSSVGQDKATVHGSGSARVVGGSGLGSVKIANISSYSFTLMWSAPQGMFKNFTLIRTESLTEGTQIDHEEFEEETLEEVKTYTVKNTTARVQLPTESSNTTLGSGSRGKAETKRISMVIPGNVRSVEFSNLRPNTAYVLQIYGSAAQRRSKSHRVTAVTGPEPATEMVFSNVTESSLSVSWSKPKTTYAAFRITYTNIVTGEYQFVSVSSQQSHVVLTKLSAGTSYIISVMATQGRALSDALTSIITTVPAPPTHLRVVNVTDTKALLQWTPSLGKVDRFIISYESSKIPNVTVTVMLAGNSVEHQLRGLQRGTVYTVKVLSQKNSHQSMAVSTIFTTANLVKASEVSARYAVIAWRTSTVVYHSYRLIYQVAGEETKEVILDGTMTEYKLTGLLPMSRYIVLVQGEREGRYTSIVTTEFITGKLRFPFPADCSQELLNGALESGEVDVYPLGKEGRSVRVYCDMETDGGGWTVFQRRLNGKTDFYRTWSEYSAGFGNLSEEFWLGNDVLYNLTSVSPMSLRVDMRYGNDTVYAHYANFSIDSKEKHYTLTVSDYTGSAGDSMRYHNGRPFSAWDKNPDPLGIHCARAYMGGWWYKNCYKTNLNGLYGSNHNNQGIVWIDWKGKDVSIPFTEMKFRPSRFSPATHS